jgi:hypothetical protein
MQRLDHRGAVDPLIRAAPASCFKGPLNAHEHHGEVSWWRPAFTDLSGGDGVAAAGVVMDQRSESAGRSVERYQLALPAPGVAAPALHLRAWVNASPPGAHGEVEGVDRARPVAGGVALEERVDHD